MAAQLRACALAAGWLTVAAMQGGGGGPPMNGEAFNLQVEVYIFSEETSIAYGGVCENKCPADASGEANCPDVSCTYTAPEDAVAAKALVPAACSNAVVADEDTCTTASGTWSEAMCTITDEAHEAACTTAGGTWSAEEAKVESKGAVPESCAQTTAFTCAGVAVDCPNGACVEAPCTDNAGCKFTPESFTVPAQSVKYNVKSDGWPFCGLDNFLSVVVEMKEGGGAAEADGACSGPACTDPDSCTEVESTKDAECAAMDLSDGGTACTAAACTFLAAPAPTDCSTGFTAGQTATCADGCSYTAPAACSGAVIADETACGTVGGTWSVDACVIADQAACGTAGGTWGGGPEACALAPAEDVLSSTGIEVKFKGRSPNVDVCDKSTSKCVNIKFGKIEERNSDGGKKVNAHSIMSLASRNNLPTWESGTTTFGSSAEVTFVKMTLDQNFKSSCKNGDGAAADPDAKPKPSKKTEAVKVGDMIAANPTTAMQNPFVAVDDAAHSTAPLVPTDITVLSTSKGMEFIFPAFGAMYYDPAVADEDAWASCSDCDSAVADAVALDTDTTVAGTGPVLGTSDGWAAGAAAAPAALGVAFMQMFW